MKVLLMSFMITSIGAMANTTYSPNDGQSSPGNFSTKSQEDVNTNTGTGQTKKVIKTTTIEKQEVIPAGKNGTELGTGSGSGSDKPILDSNPNDEPYRVGPLTVPEADSTVPEEMEVQEEDALDYSTTPDRKTVSPEELKKKNQ
jgi:hypothetical protein